MMKGFLVSIFLLALGGCSTAPTSVPPTVPVATVTSPTLPASTSVTPTLPASTSVPQTLPAPSPTVERDGSLHLVVGVQGQLRVKRSGWREYAPALFGTFLQFGDLLWLEESSQATVACADLTLVPVPRGISGVPCKVAKPVMVYGGSLLSATRSDLSSGFPLVVSPRKTKVINPRPTLRWLPVPGVITYTVSVRGPNVDWRIDVSSKTEVEYAPGAPTLVPGTAYQVIVCGGGNCSNQETLPGLGFTVLSADEARTLRDSENRIRALNMNAPATRFLLANFYATQGLNAEAIEQLEDLRKTMVAPAVVRSLGDLYLKVALNRLAEERYLQALEFSLGANDVEGQALTQYALGLIYDVLGSKSETSKRLQQALESYQKLGDVRTMNQIQERLGELSKP